MIGWGMVQTRLITTALECVFSPLFSMYSYLIIQFIEYHLILCKIGLFILLGRRISLSDCQELSGILSNYDHVSIRIIALQGIDSTMEQPQCWIVRLS